MFKVWVHVEDSDTEKDYEGFLPIQAGPEFKSAEDAIEFANEIAQ
jgi:hypothetical protein